MTNDLVLCNTVKAAARAGVTVQRFRDWTAAGLIRPARGHGWAMQWDTPEVEAATVLGAVTRALDLGPYPEGRKVLMLFAQALAIRNGAVPVGFIQEVGEYVVTVEVVEVRHAR